MKANIFAAVIFAATIINPVGTLAFSAEVSSVMPVTYYAGRKFSHYLPKFYHYQKPRYHHRGGYRNNRYHRSPRYSHRYGYGNSHRYRHRRYR